MYVLQCHCHHKLQVFQYSQAASFLCVAALMGGCLFVLFNIPRRSDALNFSFFSVREKGSPCPWRWKQVAFSSSSVSGEASLYIWKSAQGPEPQRPYQHNYMRKITATASLDTYTTCSRTHTCLCFAFCTNIERHKNNTFWPSHLLPVGYFPVHM